MARFAPLIIASLLALGACTAPSSNVVYVPTVQAAVPPPELLEPIPGASGEVFVPPGSPGVVAGLTERGRNELVGLIARLSTRLDAWRAWADPAYTDPFAVP